jgi:predicted enzyme related to lactoylglutathione lyase
MTSDVDRSRAFYTELFGWVAEDPNPDFGGYFNYTKDGVRVAGCMSSEPGSGVPDVWSTYLASDDTAKTLEASKSAGGQVYVEAIPIADLGTMGMVADPTGAAVGVWQPGAHKGFGRISEPGAPSWFELHTRDYGAALDFYRDVFGWDTATVSDTPEFRYTTLSVGDEWLAGVMDASGQLPEGVPSHWAVYFGVADADATVAKAVELGATVTQPAEDTPYGRLAALIDPTGAAFRIVAANEQMPAKS